MARAGEREGDKGPKALCPGWRHQPGQKAPVPPLARLAVGPGTKATYCPGPKGCRDKWPRTKTYSVVVRVQLKVTSPPLYPFAEMLPLGPSCMLDRGPDGV